MPSGDGLLVRIRPAGGRLPAAAARAVAAASRRWGNGRIDLTGRGALQLRGLSASGVAPLAASMVAAGLADPDPAVEARRCVLVSPLAGDDPDVAPGTAALAAAIGRALARSAAPLDGKFLVSVDGGGVLTLDGLGADVAVRVTDSGVLVDGVACPADSVPARVVHLAASGRRPGARRDRVPPVGPLPYPAGGGAFGLGLAFGALDAGLLELLADTAEQAGDGVLRLTPWRAVLLGGLRRVPRVPQAAIADPADPRLAIAACPGSAGCASGQADTRADAARLAPLARGPLHVSGCAKGCAHPAPARVTLVAGPGGYDLVRDGRAVDAPVARGLTLAQAAALLAAA
jgi:precorrin-3B synthase